MSYSQSQPHPALASHIDAYWTVTGADEVSKREKILPDGCVDIIFNPGDEFRSGDGTIMKHETIYLIGTMTRFKNTLIQPGTKLMGIRFRPGAFPSFYAYASLHETRDRTVELERALAPDPAKMMKYGTAYLDRFFMEKLSPRTSALLPVIDNIYRLKGQVDLLSLAKQYFLTPRQLERHFKRYVGASPKEFISLIRCQFALRAIRNNWPEKSLLDIALEGGYYDHSHLTKEVQKYTGLAPSLF